MKNWSCEKINILGCSTLFEILYMCIFLSKNVYIVAIFWFKHWYKCLNLYMANLDIIVSKINYIFKS